MVISKKDFIFGNSDILRCVRHGKRLKNGGNKVEVTVSPFKNYFMTRICFLFLFYFIYKSTLISQY